MDSNEYDHGNDNCRNDPPAQLNALFNAGCHGSTIELARLPPCSALPIAPLPSISEIPFPRFTNVDSRRVQPRIKRISRIGFGHSSFGFRLPRRSPATAGRRRVILKTSVSSVVAPSACPFVFIRLPTVASREGGCAFVVERTKRSFRISVPSVVFCASGTKRNSLRIISN